MSEKARRRVSVTFLGFSTDELPRMVDVAREAEAAGIDDIQLSEHVVLGSHPETFMGGAGFMHELDEAFADPLVSFGAIAGATS